MIRIWRYSLSLKRNRKDVYSRHILFSPKLVIAFFLMTLSAATHAIENVRFQRLLNQNGIDDSQTISTVNTTIQDPNGFIWFGGENGLARYDGHTIKVYRTDPKNNRSISSNAIWDMIVDHKGVLWLGTDNGLNRYDARSDNFYRYQYSASHKNSLPNNFVRALGVNSDNVLFVGTDGGLSLLDADRNTWKTYQGLTRKRGKLSSNYVRELFIDDEDRVWIGTRDMGLSVFLPDKKRFVNFHHNPRDETSLIHNNITKITKDQHGVIWIGSFGGGLCKLNDDKKTFTRYQHDPKQAHTIGSNVIWDILEDSEGNLWVATDHSGLALYRPLSDDFIHFKHSAYDDNTLLSNSVHSLYEDKNQDLWVGTFPVGTNFFDRSTAAFRNIKFEPNNPHSLSNSAILSFLEDKDGDLWIGTEGGLNYYNRATGQFKSYTHDPNDPTTLRFNSVLSLAEGPDGSIWVGTWSGGLHRFDKRSGIFKNYFPDDNNKNSINSEYIWSLEFDDTGILWVGTETGGLNRFDPKTETFTHFTQNEYGDPTTITNNHVWTLLNDRQGNLWVGTLYGLSRLNLATNRFTHFRKQDKTETTLSNDRIVSLMKSSDGKIWIGTQGGGLNIYNPQTQFFVTLTTDNGLPSNHVASIIEDDNQQIWVTTSRGAARIDVPSLKITTYQTTDGLVSNNFIRDATFKDSNGKLYVGSTEGMSIFNPQELKQNLKPPPIALTEFNLFNRRVTVNDDNDILFADINETQKLTLTHQHSVFSISYAALSYRSSLKNQYSYILEGFDQNWQDVGNKHIATYTNIDPGTYTFKVRAANRDGVWNDEGRALTITVLPSPWRSSGAYFVYGLLIFLIIVLIGRNSIKKVELDKERSVNARLIKLDKMKDAFLANTSHELRTPLNGIIGLTESLIDQTHGSIDPKTKRILDMIVSSSKRLSNLINDILDHSKLSEDKIELNKEAIDLFVLIDTIITLLQPLIGNKELVIINEIPEEFPPVLGDENRLQQIFFNLIGNAIKYTPKGHIRLFCSNLSGYVAVCIEDTGIGIPESELEHIFTAFSQIEHGDSRQYGGTGLGLALTKQLIELHDGKISVRSTEGEGSTFKVTLPTTIPVKGGPANKPTAPINERQDKAKHTLPLCNIGEVPQGEHIPCSPTPIDIVNSEYTILIVDDDAINRMVLKGILGKQQYHLLEAESGLGAIDKIQEQHIDLVVLDVMMPKMTGYEACEIIRQNHPVYTLPIIFLTAKDPGEDLIKGFACGGNDFMTKPVKKDELLARIQTHLGALAYCRSLKKTSST